MAIHGVQQMRTFALTAIAATLSLNALPTSASELVVGGPWGQCTVDYPGAASMDSQPTCAKTGEHSARCTIQVTLDGQPKRWVASIIRRPLKARFSGKEMAVPFGDRLLPCSVNVAGFTASRNCWGKRSRAGGSGGCNVCAIKGGTEQCAAVRVRIAPTR